MKRIYASVAVLACFAVVISVDASKKRKTRTSPEASFDYYVLALSWAPNYCAGHPGDHSNECRIGQQANFVLHGLWPQSNQSDQPAACAPAQPVAHELVRHMLEYFPSRGLIQHEWQQHGVCSGLSAADYFGQVEQAVNSLKIPDQYRAVGQGQSFNVKDVERSFAQANNAPADAFRVSCHGGEMVNLQVCLSKDLRYQACSASARECPAPQVLMRATR
jgi:ribonuclease T2